MKAEIHKYGMRIKRQAVFGIAKPADSGKICGNGE
jgi:hypothetical protein